MERRQGAVTTALGTPTQSVEHRAVPVPAAQPALPGCRAPCVSQSIRHPSPSTHRTSQNAGLGKGQTKRTNKEALPSDVSPSQKFRLRLFARYPERQKGDWNVTRVVKSVGRWGHRTASPVLGQSHSARVKMQRHCRPPPDLTGLTGALGGHWCDISPVSGMGVIFLN